MSEPEDNAASVGATVVMPTFRRPESLRRALGALVTQRHPGVDWDIIVVDNDDGPHARQVVEEVASRLPVRVRCVHEHERGASNARNRGISEVRAPITVFLDDDVVPLGDDWLSEVIRPLLEGRAHGVAGRVLLDPDAPRPDWFRDTWDGISFGHFDVGDEEHPVDPLGYINTANGAVETAWLRKVGGFDLVLGPRYGGHLFNEDTRLTRRLFAAGASILYTPKATVVHDLPASRISRRYIVYREYCRGRSSWLMERERHARMRGAGLGAIAGEVRRQYDQWRRIGLRVSTAYRIAGDLAYLAGYVREVARCLLSGRRIPPDEFEMRALPDPGVR